MDYLFLIITLFFTLTVFALGFLWGQVHTHKKHLAWLERANKLAEKM